MQSTQVETYTHTSMVVDSTINNAINTSRDLHKYLNGSRFYKQYMQSIQAIYASKQYMQVIVDAM